MLSSTRPQRRDRSDRRDRRRGYGRERDFYDGFQDTRYGGQTVIPPQHGPQMVRSAASPYAQPRNGDYNPPLYDDDYDMAPRSQSQWNGYVQQNHDASAPTHMGQSPPSPSPPCRDHGGFRPLALPQVTYGEGKPFLRGYSDELMQYGIFKDEMMPIVDRINKAVIPNPEGQIFQKAANIAGYFVPGVDGLAITASQIVVGAGAAIGQSTGLSKALSEANLHVFIPKGLEICIGKTQHVDEEAGFSPSQQGYQGAVDAQSRLAQYGTSVMPLSVVYSEQKKIGRQDPIAMIGRNMSAKDAQKKMQRADKEKDRGRRTRKGDSLESGLQWLIVRKASADSVAQWQKTLQKSEAALVQEPSRRSR